MSRLLRNLSAGLALFGARRPLPGRDWRGRALDQREAAVPARGPVPSEYDTMVFLRPAPRTHREGDR